MWNAALAEADRGRLENDRRAPTGCQHPPYPAAICRRALPHRQRWRTSAPIEWIAGSPAWRRSAGAEYTRYADDLAFSGGEEFERGVERFSAHVAAILMEEGFHVNHRKTRIMRQGVRQRLAGLVSKRAHERYACRFRPAQSHAPQLRSPGSRKSEPRIPSSLSSTPGRTDRMGGVHQSNQGTAAASSLRSNCMALTCA